MLDRFLIKNANQHYANKIIDQMNDISLYLKEIRNKKNIRLTDILEFTTLNLEEITKIECNGDPTLSELLEYCNCIGIDLPEILNKYIKRG
jgi:transcriptional regulator with XRE-family HTH domain